MRIRPDSDAGFSLAETLIAIVIVGVTFTAILGGMMTSITVSSAHRSSATVDSLARSAAEWIKDGVRTPYAACAGTGAYGFGGVTIPAGHAVSVAQVEYWDGTLPAGGSYAPAFGANQSTCQGAGDRGLQRITIVATDGQATETVQVIKRVAP